MSEMTVRAALAYDAMGKPFNLERDTAKWLVKKKTKSHPQVVLAEGGVLTLECTADYADLHFAVDGNPGEYRLYQIDELGDELGGTVAYFTIEDPDAASSAQAQAQQFEQLVGLCRTVIEANIAKDEVLGNMNRELLSTHVEIQRGAVAVINAANSTTMIANGLDAIEREQPQVDVEELSERLTEALGLDQEPAQEKRPWFVEVLNGPIGAAAGKFFATLPQTMAMAAAQAKAGQKGK